MFRLVYDLTALIAVGALILGGLEWFVGVSVWRELVALPVHWLLGGAGFLLVLVSLAR